MSCGRVVEPELERALLDFVIKPFGDANSFVFLDGNDPSNKEAAFFAGWAFENTSTESIRYAVVFNSKADSFPALAPS